MRSISWVSDENVWMQSKVGESVSWELDECKVLKFAEKMLWVEKTSENEWKFEFWNLEKFS